MAWGKPRVQPTAASGAKPKPFQRVERRIATVPIKEAFREVGRKEQGAGRAGHAAMNTPFGSPKKVAAEKARAALRSAEDAAARHFGGDVGKMQTHMKRWLKWGAGDLMSPAGLAEGVAGAAVKAMKDSGTYDKAMKAMQSKSKTGKAGTRRGERA